MIPHTIFEKELSKRILVLDGGFGSLVQRHGLQEADFRGERFASFPKNQKGNYDLLNITQPSIVQDIHEQYYAAGADIVTTNTLNANAVSLAQYGMADMGREITAAAVALARSAADKYATPTKPRWVAVSVGPTDKSLSISPDVERPQYRAITFHEMSAAYYEQIDAAATAGADLLLMETMFDTLNVKAALYAVMEHRRQTQWRIPLMLSATIADSSGRMLAGQTLDAFVISVSHAPLAAIGLNCALGAEQLGRYVERLAEIAPFPISLHPNAGMPNQSGGYDTSPAQFAAVMEGYMRSGWVNVVGGCCGTTPEYIAMLARVAGNYKPHVVSARAHASMPLMLSGLEAMVIE